MPPNVKETAAVIDSLATLNVNDLVHSKFLPLTQEVEADEQNETKQEAPSVDTIPPLSTKEQMIADILKDEENRDIFTAHHVESNLVQEANKDSVVAETSSSDDYWDMPTPKFEEVMAAKAHELNEIEEQKEIDNTAKVNGDLYCLWHIKHEEQKRQELIASIVEEERLRETFSAKSIEASLIADAKRRAEYVTSAHPESDSYWLWEMEA